MGHQRILGRCLSINWDCPKYSARDRFEYGLDGTHVIVMSKSRRQAIDFLLDTLSVLSYEWLVLAKSGGL
jgi:hypothetical protein